MVMFKPSLDFSLDPKGGVPFYKQIILQVEMAIADKRLSTGDQLPTVRSLAVDLKINPNTVARAYNIMEIKGIVKDVIIVDDYAHHPTEVSAALQGAMKGWNKQVVAVFQPHLYSRTRDLYKEFAEALFTADEVVIMDVYPAREEPIEGVSGALIAEELKKMKHQAAVYVQHKSDLIETVKKIIKNDSIVLFMGAGDITRYPDRLLKELQQ